MDPNALREALRERVERRLAGKGVDRAEIVRAIDAVVRALPAGVIQDTAEAGDGADSEVVLAVAASSVPDLASRARRSLELAGVSILDSAFASAGRHTVVTVRVPAASRDAAARAAAEQGWHVSVVG